jgi:hypothetical protein
MQRHPPLFAALVGVTSIAAMCPSVEAPPLPPIPTEGEGEGEGEGELDVAQLVEDAIAEKLQCEEVLRPSTLGRMRAVLHDPTFDEVRALLLAPEDLATVVALAGAQVEGSVILLRNLVLLTESGAAGDLLENGWSGVSCGDPVTLACTAGTQTTTVTCDAALVANAVTVSFDGCTLDGTLHQGAFSLARDASDDSAARLSFDGLTFNEVERYQGSLLLDVGVGPGAFAAAVSATDPLEIVEHGGLTAGLECSAETRFEVATFSLAADVATIEMSIEKQDPDKTLGLETFGEHLTFSGADCACPDVGSGVLVDVPRPLGQDGAVARARVTWSATAEAGLCARAEVALEGWPQSCDAVNDVAGDCAKGATAAVLAELLTSLCALP